MVIEWSGVNAYGAADVGSEFGDDDADVGADVDADAMLIHLDSLTPALYLFIQSQITMRREGLSLETNMDPNIRHLGNWLPVLTVGSK